jgi:hypothetical protein
VTDLRAILVSREQRDWYERYWPLGDGQGETREVGAFPAALVAPAFDAAGDQPRICICVNPKHQLPRMVRLVARGGSRVGRCAANDGFVPESVIGPCRVVDAVVVPLPEQP